jgi:hypothetical protein
MNLGRTNRNIPVLIGEITSGGIQIAAWCPFCRIQHLHGAGGDDGEGHRVAHCVHDDSPFKESGYYIVLLETMKRVKHRLREWE